MYTKVNLFKTNFGYTTKLYSPKEKNEISPQYNSLEQLREDLSMNLSAINDDKHELEVSIYASLLADMFYSFDKKQVEIIRSSARLHDIGIIFCDNSRGAEFYLEHATIGSDFLKSAGISENITDDILTHHEHYGDGNGPLKVKGENIPAGGRIISTADRLQTLLEDNPNFDEVIHNLSKIQTGYFDPKFSKLLKTNQTIFREVYEELKKVS